MPKNKVGGVGEISTKLITTQTMQDKIYYIRGQQVMLDYDLAEIYGYTTSAFNQQVARNIEKFEGEDFMFRLEERDLAELSLSQNVIAIVRTNNQIHDRFIILDYNEKTERIYHAGASEKDAGSKMTTIVRLEDLAKNALHDVVERLKLNPSLKLG